MLKPSKRFLVPEEYCHARFVLKGCGEAQAVVEYVALMRERDRLHQLFRPDDPWPSAHFSLAQHEADLEWQVSEFRTRRSFVYSVWDAAETTLIGGVYLYPSLLPGVQVEAFFWLVGEAPIDEESFAQALRRWLVNRWHWKQPVFPGRDMPWVEWPGVTYPW